MCCLFGLIDYGGNLTGKQKSKLLAILARECEVRGTDATGMAYNSGGKLRVYKKPLPAHRLRFCIPNDVAVVMGHTRMTTQGVAKRNQNNHPWRGNAGGMGFALAHNGVLYNDHSLRRQMNLPNTNIETDSYVALQILEKQNALTLDSLRYMAEQVEGSFAFSVLDEKNNLYIIKDNNPICLIHFPQSKLYLYASTKEILAKALGKMQLHDEMPVEILLDCGDILRIAATGKRDESTFDAAHLLWSWYGRGRAVLPYSSSSYVEDLLELEATYLEELKAVAAMFGFGGEQIDRLLGQGFSTDEIEEALYCCGEL